MAKFIAAVLIKGAGLIVSPYYDEFSQIEAEALAQSAEVTIKSVFRILGLRLSEAPAKDKPFAEISTPLGVVLDMSEAPNKVASSCTASPPAFRRW